MTDTPQDVFWQRIRDGYSYEQASAARDREIARESRAAVLDPPARQEN